MSTTPLPNAVRQRILCLARWQQVLWSTHGFGKTAKERQKAWADQWRQAGQEVGLDFPEMPLEQVALLFEAPPEREAFLRLGCVGASVAGLARRYLVVHGGLPVARYETLVEFQAVRQAVDLEVLACWSAAEAAWRARDQANARPRVDWPHGLGISPSLVGDALDGDLVDGHVHLGGVLGAADLWPAVLDPRASHARHALLASWKRGLGRRPLPQPVVSRLTELWQVRDLLAMQVAEWRRRGGGARLKEGTARLFARAPLEEHLSVRVGLCGADPSLWLPPLLLVPRWGSPTCERFLADPASQLDALLLDERALLAECFLGVLGVHGALPPWFGPALAIYLACRVLFHRAATQHTRRVGFESFKEWYGSPARKAMQPAVDEPSWGRAIWRRVTMDGRVRVEGRVMPRRDRIRPAIDAALDAGLEPPWRLGRDFGLVAHFAKEPDPRWKAFKKGKGPFLESPCSGRTVVTDPAFLLRHAQLREKVRGQALSLEELRAMDPEVGWGLLGIDAASTETDAPPEVFAPAFRYLRRGTAPTAEHRGPGEGCGSYPPLRATFHAGESFLHPISGLRAVWEAMEFLDLRAKDRIGHGVVLGIDYDEWLRQSSADPALPREERLDDLVWAIDLLGYVEVAGGRRKVLELESLVEAEFHALYRGEPGYSPRAVQQDLAWAWRLRWMDPDQVLAVLRGLGFEPTRRPTDRRFDSRRPRLRSLSTTRPLASCRQEGGCLVWNARMRACGGGEPCPDAKGQGCCEASAAQEWGRCVAVANPGVSRRGLAWRIATLDLELLLGGTVPQAALHLCCLHHFDRSVWARGRARTSWSPPFPDPARLFPLLRALVVAEAARRGLTVEVCPSSNQRIGAFGGLEHHPVFALSGDQGGGAAGPTVMVCTDNPGIFATNLENEYALLGRSAELRGGGARDLRRDIVPWLRALRVDGLRSTFLRQDAPDVSPPETGPWPEALALHPEWRGKSWWRFATGEDTRLERWRLARAIRRDMGCPAWNSLHAPRRGR
ncbi:MAG: hypothetical protein ABIO70_15800 [Pseudomonadota bacterium]